MAKSGRCRYLTALLAGVLLTSWVEADVVELTNGNTLRGTVVKQEADRIHFQPAEGGSTVVQIPRSRIKSLTIETAVSAPKKEPTPTPTPQPTAPAAQKTPTPTPTAERSGMATGERATRSRAEVQALIDEAGRTPLDWWDSVQPNYPKTLDLTWNKTKQWNNQRNLGQFIWDVINPNEHRWREGVKLLHHCLTVNRSDRAKLLQTIEALARMYQNLLADYARAAFWMQKQNSLGGRVNPLALAECYWKLGNKPMAVEIIKSYRYDPTGHGGLIKLWSDMGELNRALQIAESSARIRPPENCYMAAGDACRLAGRYEEAVNYYRKAITAAEASPERGKEHLQRLIARARASIEAIRLFEGLDLNRIPDGTYKSNSVGYRGQVFVEVDVKAGRIEDVRVTRHSEKQYYSSINDTTRQIIEKQSVKGVDATSRATITSEAIINAAAKALSGGMK